MTAAIEAKVCTMEDIGLSIGGEDSPPVIAAVNDYLRHFAAGPNCPRCEARLGGFLGSFTWGIVHGEGHCSGCGWPARGYHYPKQDGENIFDGPIQYPLAYHPSSVTEQKTGDTD